MKEEPPLSAKCKDKFLVQSTLITLARESMALNDLWNVIDGDDETRIHQQKLKVVYLSAEGSLAEEDYLESTQPSAMTDKYDTVRQYDNNTVRPGNGYGHPPSAHPTIPSFDMHAARSHSPPTGNRHSPTAADFSPALEVHHDEPHYAPQRRDELTAARELESRRAYEPLPPKPDLSGAYAEAQAEIQRLRAMLAAAQETGLHAPGVRRRTKALSDDGSYAPGETEDGTFTEQSLMQAEGVPLQVVAIVAFTVFFVTYLFF